MAVSAFLGLRGTGDWPANYIPQNWREMILRLYPNGMAPLTALLALLKEEKTDSVTFNWWEKPLPTQRATGTKNAFVYINSTLATAYVYATHQATIGIAGGIVYVKVTAAQMKEFRAGHQVMLRDSSRSDVDVHGRVNATHSNGNSSYIAVELDEADDNGASGFNLTTVDTILVVGNASAQGSNLPVAQAYSATQGTNTTQIFRTAINMTRTAWQEKQRTGVDPLADARKDGLELHSIEMEKALLWSLQRTSLTGTNGQPLTLTQGMIPMIKASSTSVNSDYRTATAYSGQTWIQGGENWLEGNLATLFQYAGPKVMGFCGQGAMLGIQRLVKNAGHYELTRGTAGYGIAVTEWQTVFGTIQLQTHPLFSYESSNSYALVLFEPKNLVYRYMQDTLFQPDNKWKEGGWGTVDAINEGWLTECGLEYHFPEKFAYLDGLGQDNAV